MESRKKTVAKEEIAGKGGTKSILSGLGFFQLRGEGQIVG